MKTKNINHLFLDDVMNGKCVDYYYHLGTSSDDPILSKFKNIKSVIMCGSGGRIKELASKWSKLNKDAEIIALPKEDRFVTRYCADVLFASHGMGMPSASIAIQELMRLTYFLKDGNLDELDKIFWCRVGTSGGVGVEGGDVIVTTESLMGDLKPYRLINGGFGEYWFGGEFPPSVISDIINSTNNAKFNVVAGKTIGANDFFLEQFRLDGAVCMETSDSKMNWLTWIHENGVKNIEMEGPMIAGYLNHWGFSKFAMICCSIVNRLNGDQITSTPEELKSFDSNAATVLFNYLIKHI